MRGKVTFRCAERKDTALLLGFIREHAGCGGMPPKTADEAALEEWIFDQQKACVIFAAADGREAGFALFSRVPSADAGPVGIGLEALHARPECRSRVLLKKLAAAGSRIRPPAPAC